VRIHLLGPSGSGTSTLGKLVADRYGYPWFDSDDFFWCRTDPPFVKIREREERIDLLKNELSGGSSWVLSGSIMGWGDFLKPFFDLVIYKYVEPEARMKRILAREIERYGSRIEPGNDMYQKHLEFMDWARRYDTGGMEMRSRISETSWLEGLECKKIMLAEDMAPGLELELVSKEVDRLLKDSEPV
jgi:adenylate kinase family enzyme